MCSKATPVCCTQQKQAPPRTSTCYTLEWTRAACMVVPRGAPHAGCARQSMQVCSIRAGCGRSWQSRGCGLPCHAGVRSPLLAAAKAVQSYSALCSPQQRLAPTLDGKPTSHLHCARALKAEGLLLPPDGSQGSMPGIWVYHATNQSGQRQHPQRGTSCARGRVRPACSPMGRVARGNGCARSGDILNLPGHGADVDLVVRGLGCHALCARTKCHVAPAHAA